MPRKTVEKVLMRMYALHHAGRTLDEIVARLEQEFPDGLVPDRSTVFRRLKKIRDVTKETEPIEDVPFTWSAMSEAPWEASRMVLDLWHYYVVTGKHQDFGPFTSRMAKWAWRVVHALGLATTWDDRRHDLNLARLSEHGRPELNFITASEIIDIVQEYSRREIAVFVLDEPFDTRDLDCWIAAAPWMNRVRLETYQDMEHLAVKWHDEDIPWLKKVAPEAGSRREFWANTYPPPEIWNLPENEITHQDARAKRWYEETEGLLKSQISEFHIWLSLKRKSIADQEFPPDRWHLSYCWDVYYSIYEPEPEIGV